jgi:hypothetical protein
MPIVQMASIGTQISEAFAGLDRIQEILNTPREDADDASRTALRPARRHQFRTSGSNTTPARSDELTSGESRRRRRWLDRADRARAR